MNKKVFNIEEFIHDEWGYGYGIICNTPEELHVCYQQICEYARAVSNTDSTSIESILSKESSEIIRYEYCRMVTSDVQRCVILYCGDGEFWTSPGSETSIEEQDINYSDIIWPDYTNTNQFFEKNLLMKFL